jgi:hypothetical protein
MVQLYANHVDQLQEMEDAVEFLDHYYAPSFGNAKSPRYYRESKTRVPEGNGRWQTTVLLTARYTDARKWEG